MKKINLLSLFAVVFLLTSCEKSGETLEGKLYDSGYVYIQFQMDGKYETFQKTSRDVALRGCQGEGTWTYEGNKITINQNNSGCEPNINVAGEYILEGNKISNSNKSFSSSY